VVHGTGFHQVDDGRVAGKRRAGKPHQVTDAHAGSGLQRQQRHLVTVPEVVVCGDNHAVAEAALLESRLQVRYALVAGGGVIMAGADRGRVLASARPVQPHTFEGRLLAPVDNGRNTVAGSVLHQFRRLAHRPFSLLFPAESATKPMARACFTSFRAR
jgi:acyl-coenzyme A thioesterase PaaI-like protein